MGRPSKPSKDERDAARSRFQEQHGDCLACVAGALAAWECERLLKLSEAVDARIQLRKHQQQVHGRVTVPLPVAA
jgi:hypothetical protein